MSQSYQTSIDILQKTAELIHQKSGIIFPENHLKVLDTRIQSYIEEHYYTEQQLFEVLLSDSNTLATFIGHVTTNHTHFFRSIDQFDILVSRILPELLEKNISTKTINIWSAACSSGEEPYTIALCVKEYLKNNYLKDWTFSILATDIDPKSLKIAKEGVFPLDTIKYIPDQYHKYVNITKKIDDQNRTSEGYISIPQEIKDHIHFKIHNLIKSAHENSMDIIFCRNVLIYFNEETQTQVVSNLVKNLAPNRYFYVSPTETLTGLKTSLKPIILPKCIFYMNN